MAPAKHSHKIRSEGKLCIEPFRKFLRPEKPIGGCFMAERFSCYAKLCTFFGCFFIRGFRHTSVSEARATWRSLYTLYAAVWVTLFLSVEVWQKLEQNNRESSMTHSAFTAQLEATVYLCSLLTGLVNLLCMVFGSSKLVVFFKKAALFEASSGVSDLLRESSLRSSWFQTTRKAGVAVSAFTTFGFLVGFVVEDSSVGSQGARGSSVAGIFLRVLSLAAFTFYECTMYVVVSTLNDVLVFYTRSQGRIFRTCQRHALVGRICGQTAGLAVEKVRRNLNTIRKLKTGINAIWSPAILAGALCLLWIHCTTWYCFFADEEYHLYLWFGLGYSSYCTLSMLDLVMISHSLCHEARSIKDVARSALLEQADDTYAWQVQFLHSSIDPEDMRLTGSDFFYLDRGLLVAMAGSIITYTVILVQTSSNLASHSKACPGAAT